MKYISTILFCLFGLILQAQNTDTMSVYFEFGEWRVSNAQVKRIRAIPRNIYINDLDSVVFVGVTDSVGSVKDNLKLGLKRAHEVARFCRPVLTTSPTFSYASIGEGSLANAALNRRVDLIFYSSVKTVDSIIPISNAPFVGCWRRADSLLHRSFVHTITFRHEAYVVVETFMSSKTLNNQYFTASMQQRSGLPDTIIIEPLRWRSSKIADNLGRRRDMYTKIRKSDFDRFEIFTKDTLPCLGCRMDLESMPERNLSNQVDCEQVDRFLMNHIQIKNKWFSAKNVRIRVPQSLVNLEFTYYPTNRKNKPIEWRTFKHKSKVARFFRKFRFRKNKARNNGKDQFYYAELPLLRRDCVANILRVMKCCEEMVEPSEAQTCFISGGGGFAGCGGVFGYGVLFTKELGYYRMGQEHVGYLAVDFEKFGQHGEKFDLKLGITEQISPLFNLSMTKNFISIPYYKFSNVTSWQSPNNLQIPKGILTNYYGASVSFLRNNEKQSALNHFVYLGITNYNLHGTQGYNAWFINAGYGFDYLKNMKASPQIQFGVRFTRNLLAIQGRGNQRSTRF